MNTARRRRESTPRSAVSEPTGALDSADQHASRWTDSVVLRRYTQLRDRVEASAAGHLRRRARELDIMNHALIMGSLSLTLLIPALVTLAALIPLGRQTGIAADFAHRMGLSAQATRDLQALFPTSGTAAGAATGVSAAATIVFAIGWPAELQRGYQSIWGLPARGLRDMWRLLVWLISFFSLVALVTAAGALVSGVAGVVLTAALGVPVSFAWVWWTQHLLLAGRVPWRALLPGALATSATLLGFRLVMYFYLPVSIVSNEKKYGGLGVVFAMLSWVIGFSFVMLGGPLAGHTIFVRRQSRMVGACTEPPGGLRTESRDREPAE